MSQLRAAVGTVTQIIKHIPGVMRPRFVKALVRLLFGRRRGPDLAVECRCCGTTLSPDANDCSECDSDAVITYEIT